MPLRLPILFAAVWAALAVCLPSGPAYSDEAAFPKDSRIGLVLPPGNLKPSARFTGFEDSARKVSITIFDLPGPAYEAAEQAAFGKAANGLTVRTREMFSFAGGLGYLITGRATIDGQEAHAWYLLTNMPTAHAGRIAAFIRVHVPDDALAAYPDAAIRAALRTVTFRAPPLDALLKRLPFTLKKMAGFRVMRVAPPGLVVLIDGPTDDPIKHPYMVVGVGTGAPREPADQARFARDLLSSAPVGNLSMTSMESMRLGGWPGIEIRADGKGPDGAPLALVQWLRFRGNAFVRVIGVVAQKDWDSLFPRFRAVRDGIDLR